MVIEDMKILKSMKWINNKTATTFLAELGPISNYAPPIRSSLPMPELIRRCINLVNMKGAARSPREGIGI
jgi:hypothetical protein